MINESFEDHKKDKNVELKKKLALLMPLILVPTMFLIFQILLILYGAELAWYLGLFIYWLLWGLLFSFWMIGWEKIKKLIKPQKPDRYITFLVIIPLIIAAIGRFGFGMDYEKINFLTIIGLIITAFGNGFFEEIIWRGVYKHYYSENYWISIGWSSFWFGLWHFAPGSVSSLESTWILIIGALFFGLFLSILVKFRDTLWWSILVHTIGAFIMIS